METPPKYPEYTSGKFWGGTVLPFWVLMTTSVLTGFFGLDHLLFRSPSTALLKFITNLFTFGLWYWYDIVQLATDREFVKEYGLSKPMSGAAGLGLDYFRGLTEKDTLPPSKTGLTSLVFFLLYLMTTLFPFGVSNFVAGDVRGGFVKFLMSFGVWGFFWIPFFFVSGLFEVFRNLTETGKVFTEGALRPTPLSFFMNPTGYSPNVMDPKTIKTILEKEEKEKNKEGFSLYNTFVKPILSFFGVPDPKEILDTTKCQVVPPIEKTISAAKTAADGVMEVAGTVPAIATEATAQLSAFTDPEKLKQAALAVNKVQTGGASQSSPLDYLFVGGLAFLIVGGLSAAFLRKALGRRNAREETTPDDRPSKPHLL